MLFFHRRSSLFCSVFLPLNFSGISKGFFFQQLTLICPFISQWLQVRVSFFLPLLFFSFKWSFPLDLTFSSTFDKVVSPSLLLFSSLYSFPPSIHHCFHISSMMCFAVHVTFSLFLHIWVTMITVPYFFPLRQISCAIFSITDWNSIFDLTWCNLF